jgi:hypothetical protein
MFSISSFSQELRSPENPVRFNRPETVADGQIVNGANNQLFGGCQLVSACGSDNERHGQLLHEDI